MAGEVVGVVNGDDVVMKADELMGEQIALFDAEEAVQVAAAQEEEEAKQAVEYIVMHEQVEAAGGHEVIMAPIEQTVETTTTVGAVAVAAEDVGEEVDFSIRPPRHIIAPDEVIVDPEEALKSFYTTHANTLGDSWYICKKCPTFKTSHNSTLRDHVNVEHMKISLKCTHCDFETLRFKTLNSHRKQSHGLGAFACWMEKCSFKSILTPKMLDHLMKKHNLSRYMYYTFLPLTFT